jgi:hypothetical protein
VKAGSRHRPRFPYLLLPLAVTDRLAVGPSDRLATHRHPGGRARVCVLHREGWFPPRTTHSRKFQPGCGAATGAQVRLCAGATTVTHSKQDQRASPAFDVVPTRSFR